MVIKEIELHSYGLNELQTKGIHKYCINLSIAVFSVLDDFRKLGNSLRAPIQLFSTRSAQRKTLRTPSITHERTIICGLCDQRFAFGEIPLRPLREPFMIVK
jgi:hypothetical protein